MLVHLSNTSPYVCDLNRGPIEQANRMASAPTKKATALLEQKDSFQKQTRAPLKLLAPDEVHMDSTVTTTDFNASLQPVWYSEQTIVDVQQEDIASIIQEQQQQGKLSLLRTTLPPIQSESPSFTEEIEELPTQTSLMHKSSTFTIESSMHVDSPLNDSEKENVIKEDTTMQITPPSDDSFRALEQLLGLGSATTVRDSPKTNHDTLSLTVVTPTDIINSTRRSSRISYAPKGDSGSLPSSQDIPTMPTIESITSTNPPSFLIDNTTMEEGEPSILMNQQTSFDITDNDTIKDDSNNDDEANFSFELNDFPNNSKNESMVNVPESAPPMIIVRAPTCADVAYRALIKPRTGGRISQPIKADSPLAKQNKLRSSAPTSRMLRSSCRRISTDSLAQNSINQEQPISSNPECFVNDVNTTTELVEIISLPEEDEIEQEKTTSVTLNITSPKETEEILQNTSVQSEKITTPTKLMMPTLSREYTYNTPKRRLSQRRRSMLNSSYATPMQSEQTTIDQEVTNSPSIGSNSMLGILLTKPTTAEPRGLQKKSVVPTPVRTSTPTTINETAPNSPSIASKSMLDILLTKPTDAEPKTSRKPSVKSSPARTSTRTTINEEAQKSPSIASKSMLDILLTKPTEVAPSVLQTTSTTPSSARPSRRTIMHEETPSSPSIASKSMLGILLTQPTEAEPSVLQKTSTTPSSARISKRSVINKDATNSPSIASKSMLGILLTNPTEDEPSAVQKTSLVRTSTRNSGRLSSNPTPRASINPLHSSTPSATRHKSLQMVSIGEQEQVSTTVPQQINIEIQETEMVPLNDAEESMQEPSTIEIGVQTTPSLDVSRRRLNVIQQQTTSMVQMNKSSSMVVDGEEQITPLQTKVVINLQRSVRFQLTPATDARLVAREQLEENLRGLKPDIVINPTPIIPEIKQEKVKSVPIKKVNKPRKRRTASKKKKVAATKKVEPKSQPIEKKSRQSRKEKTIKQEKTIPSTKDSKKKTEVTPATKPVSRKRKITEAKTKPVAKRVPSKRKVPKVTVEPVVKRISQKRTIREASIEPAAKRVPPKQSIPEATIKPIDKRTSRKRTIPEATTEPIAKRAKTSKSIEVKKQSIEVPLPPSNLPKTRSRSTNNKKNISQPIERQPRTKTEPPTIKTTKRGLQNVEKTEKLEKKVEEEKIQSIPPVQNLELSQGEQQKIEALTVAGLKSRLNTHKEDIPKGAKKADLIALLIKIETNLLKKPAKIETATVNTTAMTTRRRKK